jgi:hypothetical protein
MYCRDIFELKRYCEQDNHLVGSRYVCMYYQILVSLYRVSQKWRTNYLLPYPGCLNVHEKNMEKIFQTKKLLLFLLLSVIQCQQRCTRT